MELHHLSYAKQRRYYRVFWTKMDFYEESEDKYVRDQITKFETVYLRSIVVPFLRCMALLLNHTHTSLVTYCFCRFLSCCRCVCAGSKFGFYSAHGQTNWVSSLSYWCLQSSPFCSLYLRHRALHLCFRFVLDVCFSLVQSIFFICFYLEIAGCTMPFRH